MSELPNDYEKRRKEKHKKDKQKYESKMIHRRIRYTKDEFKKIEDHAAALNFENTTSYIKAASLSRTKQISKLKKKNIDHIKHIGQLKMVGNNINQIAKAMNSELGIKNFTQMHNELQKSREALNEMLVLLFKELNST